MDARTLSKFIGRCDSEFVIAVEEDFGNHEWLWFPGIPREELEAWWTALEDVETFWREETRANWPGDFVRMDENIKFSALWERIWNTGNQRARVAMNEQFELSNPDTYLCRSDGSLILHKGAFALGDGIDSEA